MSIDLKKIALDYAFQVSSTSNSDAIIKEAEKFYAYLASKPVEINPNKA